MGAQTHNPLRDLIHFLDRLDQAKIWYRLDHVRDSILVLLAVPGERWEVEFFEDGHIEIERFVSTGAIEEQELLKRLFANEESS